MIRPLFSSCLRGLCLALFAMAPLAAMAFPDPIDCVRSEPTPLLNVHARGVVSHRFTSISPYEAREVVRFRNSAGVVINHGGCEYFVNTLRFSSPLMLKEGATPVQAYAEAAVLLRQLQRLKPQTSFDLPRIASQLESLAGKPAGRRFGEESIVSGTGSELMPVKVKLDSAGRDGGVGFVQVTLSFGPL